MHNRDTFFTNRMRKIKPYPDYAITLIDWVKNLQQINTDELTLDSVNDLTTHQQFVDVCKFLNDEKMNNPVNEYDIYSAMSRTIDHTPVQYIHPKHEVIAELKALEKHELFEYGSNYFFFATEIQTYYPDADVTFNFGKFRFVFQPDIVTAKGISGNTIKDSAYHPYINSETEKVCLGDYDEAYKAAFIQMRYQDAVDIVIQALTTYGGDDQNELNVGPHHPFVLWIGKICEDCGETFEPDLAEACGSTNKNMCPTCAENSKDEHTGTSHLSAFIDHCDACGKNSIKVKKHRDTNLNWCLHCRMAKNYPVLPPEDPPPPGLADKEPIMEDVHMGNKKPANKKNVENEVPDQILND